MKKINKEGLELLKKAGDKENYETHWENGEPVPKKKSEIKKGRLSKSRGARFELKVRRDLEEKGRVVDKWTNNVEFENNFGKLIIAKRKYNPFSKVMTLGTGFPDFITISHIHGELYSVIGVEVKINGILSKEEKEKCAWYLKNKIFSSIWIAREKEKNPDDKSRKTEIEYVDFAERYSKFM